MKLFLTVILLVASHYCASTETSDPGDWTYDPQYSSQEIDLSDSWDLADVEMYTSSSNTSLSSSDDDWVTLRS